MAARPPSPTPGPQGSRLLHSGLVAVPAGRDPRRPDSPTGQDDPGGVQHERPSLTARVGTPDVDPQPQRWSKEGRQFAVVDGKGNVAAYTGPRATTWAGDRQARHVTAQGNILAGPGVVDSMLAAYQRTPGHMAHRLVAALEAGQAAGGDTRGMQSAAMLIVKKGAGVWLNNDVVLRLQVDDKVYVK